MLWRLERAKVDRDLDRLIRQSRPPVAVRERRAARWLLLWMGAIVGGLLVLLFVGLEP